MNIFNQVKDMIRGRRIYFLNLSLLVFISAISILISGQGHCSIPREFNHPVWLNILLINYTFMGNGLFAVTLAFLFIYKFKRNREGISLLTGFLISTAIVQLVKNAGNLNEVTLYLEQGQYLFHKDNSIFRPLFISGHTGNAFSLVTVLVLYSERKIFHLPLLVMAAILGFSRMYLAQHLLGDIVSGALVGTGSGVAVVLFSRMRSFGFAAFRNKFKVGYKTISPSGENNLPLIQ